MVVTRSLIRSFRRGCDSRRLHHEHVGCLGHLVHHLLARVAAIRFSQRCLNARWPSRDCRGRYLPTCSCWGRLVSMDGRGKRRDPWAQRTGHNSNRQPSSRERQRAGPRRFRPRCLVARSGARPEPSHPIRAPHSVAREPMSYNAQDAEYLQLIWNLLEYGEERTDRTGTGTLSLFGEAANFELGENFPLLTSKKVHWKSVVHELLWIMSGDTNVRYLQENGVTIWDEWAATNGDLGPVYGKQWRNFNGVDQLKRLIDGLTQDPHSRRHIISAWNPADIDAMALPPCHALVQFYVSQVDNSLSCQLYQRSADVFLGVPFNIASYSLLTCILADTLGFERGALRWLGGDTHLYMNHLGVAREQLARSRGLPPAPTLKKIEATDPLTVRFEDIVLENYNPLSALKAPVSV